MNLGILLAECRYRTPLKAEGSGKGSDQEFRNFILLKARSDREWGRSFFFAFLFQHGLVRLRQERPGWHGS